DGERGGARGRRARASGGGRRARPGREPPLVGAVRSAAAGVPRRGPAAVRPRPGRGGAGVRPRVGAVRRFCRRRGPGAHVRGVGRVEGAADEVRLHARPRRRDREGADGGTDAMRPTELLHEAGQSLWLDNITRGMLTSGELSRYIDEYTITGLTSNPSI